MSSTVSIVRCNTDLSRALRMSLSLIGGVELPAVPILIKPNLCAESDPTGVATTQIPLIMSVIDLILTEDEQAEIKIVESNSSGKQINQAYQNLGYTQMARTYQEKGYNVALINLSTVPFTQIHLSGAAMNNIHVPTLLTQPKFFISLANAKTHSLTHITGVLKNQFGCLPKKEKNQYHRNIDRVILDINRVISPDLCVIDARFGLAWVLKGRKRKLGIIVCGRDPVAVDAIIARVMGFTPSKIKHLNLAEKQGLGSLTPKVKGEALASVSVKFQKEMNIFSMLGKYIPYRILPLARKLYSLIT